MARGRKAAAVLTGPVDGPWDLPDGWRWKILARVGQWGSGGTPKAKTPSFYGGDIPWFKIGDLQDGWTQPPKQTITELGLSQSSAKMVPANTLLVAMYGSIGKLGLTSFPCATNQAIAFCIPNRDDVELKWLFYYLLGRRAHLLSLGKGGTQQNISQTVLLQEPVPVPPLETQRRVVGRIDDLFIELDDGEAALERARDDLETYRKSLLKAAVSGELTADWRASNPPEETGEKLLQRILAERKARWEENPKTKRKPYKDVVFPDAAEDKTIPLGWVSGPLEAFVDCLDHQRKPINKKERAEREGPVPYYGANGQVGWIDDWLFDEPLVLVVEDETFTGREKDFSYLISGKSWVNNHAHVLRAGPYLRPAYLNALLARYPFIPLTTGTTGRKKLTKRALMSAPVTLPPLNEQDAILGELGSLSETAPELQKEISAMKKDTERLKQSVLAAAFKGELVQ